MADEVRKHIRRIEHSRADFPDAHFDLVLSNQVLEHVTEPEAVIADMARLLKSGGILIAAFPIRSTWYEGHLFVLRTPLATWHGSSRRLCCCSSSRLGLYRETLTASEWASKSERTLDDVCFYYPRMRMLRALRTVGVANDISVDYMRTRLGNRVRYVPDAALRFLYHKRAGEIFRVVKTP